MKWGRMLVLVALALAGALGDYTQNDFLFLAAGGAFWALAIEGLVEWWWERRGRR